MKNSSDLNQNLTTDHSQDDNSKSTLDALGLSLGVIGVGIAIFSYGLSNLITIQSNRDFQELKVYVMNGPYFARNFKKKFTPMDYLYIFGFWAFIGIIIIITNIPNSRSTKIGLFKFFIGLIITGIGLYTIGYGLTEREHDFSTTIQAVLNQLRNR